MSRRFPVIVFGFLGIVALVGCGKPTLKALTTAPPGTIADYGEDSSNESRWVDLSQGIAIAIECTESGGKACPDVPWTVDDPTIATTQRAYSELAHVERFMTGHVDTAKSVNVVVGRREGVTTVHAKSESGDVAVRVTVRKAPTGD